MMKKIQEKIVNLGIAGIVFAGECEQAGRMMPMQAIADGVCMYAYEITHFEAIAEGGEVQQLQVYGGQAELSDITAAIAATCMPIGGEGEEVCVCSTPSEEGITAMQPQWQEEQHQTDEQEEAAAQSGEQEATAGDTAADQDAGGPF